MSWDDHRFFLAVLDAGSFSGAARKLGVSHPTVRARIDALEAALGTVLFVRSGSGLVPTNVAKELHAPALAMAAAAHHFIRHATSSENDISGRVRLSVPEVVGTDVMPPMLRTLRERYPGLQIELVLSNRNADLLTNEVDLAVRVATPVQEALVARKVASIPLGLFASPDYLARRGTPASLHDLRAHDLVGPDRHREDWAIATSLALDQTSASFVVRTDSHPAQIAAARAGIGIAACQVPLGYSDPALVRVLPDITLQSPDTWIVAHENVLRVPRIRAVFDHLVDAYKDYASIPPPAPLAPVFEKILQATAVQS
jgi:DNA-binding transcriptional LysR family regulator